MPRAKKPPRLYLDPTRREWAVRDGNRFIRTGCLEQDSAGAERHLHAYLGEKHVAAPSVDPLIDDALAVYAREHLPKTRGRKNAAWHIGTLSQFWSGKRTSDINARTCRQYASGRRDAGARRDLEVLRAAVRYWHKHYGPLSVLPSFVLPPKPSHRERWLTRQEAKRLRLAAMQWPHLYRFVIIGLLTGSRASAIFDMQWDWIDLRRRTMRRRAPGEAEDQRKRTPTIRISPAFAELLRKWKRRDAGCSSYVVNYNGARIHRIKRTWNQARALAGLSDDVTPHTLRHTRTTWLMQAGIDLAEASNYLGMTIQTLERVYFHHHPDFQGNAPYV